MPIPSPKVQIYPVAGETGIKNIVDGTLFDGTGTATLVDEGAEKAWSIATGTLLELGIPAKTIDGSVAGGGVAIAIRFKLTANGSGTDFMPLIGVKTSAGTIADNSVTITRNGANAYRGRTSAGLPAPATSKANNVIHTLVYKPAIDNPALDFGKIWWNTVGRVDSTPNAVSTGANFGVLALAKAFINCQGGAAFTLLDFAFFDVEPTDADCAAIADDYRAVMPAPSGGGTAPTGTTTVGAITKTSTTASVPYTYSGSDQTGFEYQLNSEPITTATNSPQSLSGLTPGTPYSIKFRPTNASGPGAWSAVANFTTDAASDTTPPTFTAAPAVTSITQTAATVSATINETGSIFYVIVPQAEATPSVAQVIAGQNAAGGAPVDSGSAINTTTLSDSIAGMSAGLGYKLCIVARDDEGTPNVQTTVTVVNFTTESVAMGVFTSGALHSVVDDALMPNRTFVHFTLYDKTTGALVVRKAGLTSNAGGVVSFSDAAVVTGTEYMADWLTTDGEYGMPRGTAS